MDKSYLSKSLFLRGLQCQKSLYLQKYRPELKDELSEEQQALFQSGTDVGYYAQQLFPGGVNIPYEGLTHEEQLSLTRSEIDKGTRTIYEATFSFDDVFVKADILHKTENGWNLYEVKSSTEIKDANIADISVQYYVLHGAGLSVVDAFLVHIDNEYVRNGEIEPQRLFKIVDVTETILGKQASIAFDLLHLRDMLAGDMPQIDIGEHCSDPYECDFQGHCWQHIPDDSVFSLRGRGVDKFELYGKGIIHLKDVPQDILNDNQLMQLESFIDSKIIINKDGIKDFLSSLWHPMCFLDFETFMPPIPLFDGTSPYQQMPFQYSLYAADSRGCELKYFEYLAYPNIDPREELLQKLLGQIPSNACVVAYNSSFEARILRSLGEQFPQYQKRIDIVLDNMRDLMIPFRRRDYYHYQMNGSYSLKAVLPVLIPDLSYDELEISDGGLAMNAYFEMCNTDDQAEVDKIRRALLEYCKLDTLAMVRILEKLREMSA